MHNQTLKLQYSASFFHKTLTSLILQSLSVRLDFNNRIYQQETDSLIAHNIAMFHNILFFFLHFIIVLFVKPLYWIKEFGSNVVQDFRYYNNKKVRPATLAFF